MPQNSHNTPYPKISSLDLRPSEKRTETSLENPSSWLINSAGGGSHTLAGTNIGPLSSLEITTHFACLHLKSTVISSIPCNLYKTRKSGGKDIATGNPLHEVLSLEPNDEMTTFQRQSAHYISSALWGDASDFIDRNRAGWVTGLWPIVPTRIKKIRVGDYENQVYPLDDSIEPGDIAYKITTRGKPIQYVPKEKILYIPGLFSFNGLVGKSSVDIQRLRLGIAKALDFFEANYFGRGFQNSLIAEVSQDDGSIFLPNDKREEIGKYLQSMYSGWKNSHGMMVAEGGIKIKPLETRLDHTMIDELSLSSAYDICGFHGVPPPLVGLLDRATFNNIEELNRFFWGYAINPWIVNDTKSLNARALTPAQRRAGYIVGYDVEQTILKANPVEMALINESMFDRGALSQNELRESRGLNPIENGDKYYVPLNFREVGKEPFEKPNNQTRFELIESPLKKHAMRKIENG